MSISNYLKLVCIVLSVSNCCVISVFFCFNCINNMEVMLQLHGTCCGFFSWPTVAESCRIAETGRQQRVMVIGNNNVFEIGCRILSVCVILT